MMCQAEQPQPFLLNDNHSEHTSDPQALDDEDLSRVLLDQSRSTPCNSSLKKEILLGIYEKRVGILKEYEELDGLHLGVDLATRFTSLLSYFLGLKSNIKKGGNQDLTNCMVTLFRIDSVYQENHQHLKKRMCRNDLISTTFSKFRAIMKKVQDKALELANNADSLFGQVKLTAEQNSITFHKNRQPTDTALQKCLKCGHDTIFLPESEKTIRDRNTERVQKYREDLEAWNEHQKKHNNNKNHARRSKKQGHR